MEQIALQVENLSKQFRKRTITRGHTTLKGEVFKGRWWKGRKGDGYFSALQDVSFNVTSGKTLGIIGRNGSGKTTLLKLLAGILKPDNGQITIDGRVAALIELGAGFHPEFSGRENILINGMVLGLSKQEIHRRMEEIIAFAELEEFIDDPVRTYSSGMYMRLGFAIAVKVDPDILLIDEILAVGDESFTHKCQDTLSDFKRRGKTIVIVTHDLEAVERWVDEAILLHDGRVKDMGQPRMVIDQYRKWVAEKEGQALQKAHDRIEGELGEQVDEAGEKEDRKRWGSREIEIAGVKLFNRKGEESYLFESGEGMRIEISYLVHQAVEDPVFGIGIFKPDGTQCYGTNTLIDQVEFPSLPKEGTVSFVAERLDLVDSSYFLDVAVHAEDGYPYDYQSHLYSFAVRSKIKDGGVFRPPHQWVVGKKE